MAMSRKHYREVAEIIKNEREAAAMLEPNMASAVLVSTFIVADKLATMFSEDNPGFGRDKFFKACGFDK